MNSKPWQQKELLSEEFKSLGFYISNHPLNEYQELFSQLKISTYSEFYNNEKTESLVAGTIMSLQEKKSSRGTPYAIIKFSDNKGEFELFLFAEMLINSRNKLKESESFILTLQKEKNLTDSNRKRINVKRISSLEEMINKPFENVTIELDENYKIMEIKEILSGKGETNINLIFKYKDKKINYLLQNKRKFDLKHLKALKDKEYVAKITV